MKKLMMVTAMVLGGGCAHQAKNESGQFKPRMEQALKKAQSMMYASTCDDKSIQSHEYSKFKYEAGNCGLLYDDLMATKKLEAEICPALKLKGKSCTSRIAEVYAARVKIQYNHADKELIKLMCESDPLKCDHPRKLELYTMILHNLEIDRQFKNEVNEINASLERERQAKILEEEESSRRSSAFAAALSSFGNSLQQSSYEATPIKQTDYSCMQRCQQSGSMYTFCKSKCEY